MINKDRLRQDFLELLQIDSPSRREGQIAAVVAMKLRDIGFTVKEDDAAQAVGGEAGNIIATLPATNPNGERILLCAHMDTVAPTTGINIIEEDGIIRQTGAAVLGADDKGGIAAILEGMRSVVESGRPHGQIQVLILVCEEIGLLGSKHLDMSVIDSDLAYVLDSGLPVAHLVTSAPTHQNIVAQFTGRSAHAGVCPEEGISAVQAAALAISQMKLGRVDFETTSNVGIISGGTARNIVPEHCEIRAEARSRDQGKLTEQVRHMREEMERGASAVGATVSVETTEAYRGYRHERESALMQFALKAAAACGAEPELMAHGGGSDCNILNAKGLPCAVVGVGYDKIHTPEEFIALDNLAACTEFVSALAIASGS